MQKLDHKPKVSIPAIFVVICFFALVWYLPAHERFGFFNIPFWFVYLIALIGFISILSDLFSFFMKKRRAQDFAISIILFIFSIYYSIGVYEITISIQETENYLNTKGKILENEIRWTGNFASKRPTEFYLHLKYSYTSPDGIEQIGSYTYLYRTNLSSLDASENFVKQYPIGSEITVFYNPKNPKLFCLFPGFDGGMDWYLYFEIIDLVIVILLIYVSLRFLYLGIIDKGLLEKESKLIQQKIETNFKDQIGTLPSKTERTYDEQFHIFTVRWMSYLMLIVLSMPIFVSIGYIFFYREYENLFLFQNRNPTIIEMISILFFIFGIIAVVLILFNKTIIRLNRISCIIFNSPIRWRRIKKLELANFKNYFIIENPTFFGNELWAKDLENNDIFIERFDSYDQVVFFKKFMEDLRN
ncbi:PF12158 family protein [Leptospira kirschneri str. 200801925]|uniref:PF12158 family protein n=1 Tax=Leptospira kirschneri str. 200802841 TaxID=1193047 RepID=A0A828Y907_9LEPT|nr:DUF3592 domain-containing protein [Leptospira kirschneri]EKO52219.1 PF12158 family protein [Leptospira kirschneri str. 200802841]EMO75460.1 PF12158 family protein [Leptospira kirschneri str. 200801925]